MKLKNVNNCLMNIEKLNDFYLLKKKVWIVKKEEYNI